MSTCLKCYHSLPEDKFKPMLRSFPAGDYRDVRYSHIPYCTECEAILEQLILSSQSGEEVSVDEDTERCIGKYYQMLVDEKHINENPHLQPPSPEQIQASLDKYTSSAMVGYTGGYEGFASKKTLK